MNPNIAQGMLDQIPDPAMRQQYANILNGQVAALVHCNSKFCGGRVIAQIMSDGSVQETEPVTPSEARIKALMKAKKPIPHYVSGLEGDRVRLDGSRGFRCYCGNSSILHEHEQGIISHNQPSKRDLERVFGKLQARPSNYVERGNMTEVDGFTIEKVVV